MKTPKRTELRRTIQVASIKSLRVDQDTFLSSVATSETNFWTFPIILFFDVTGLVGFEPTTHGFGDRCSASWSYRPSISLYIIFSSHDEQYAYDKTGSIF
jgi:hypothetical protein